MYKFRLLKWHSILNFYFSNLEIGALFSTALIGSFLKKIKRKNSIVAGVSL